MKENFCAKCKHWDIKTYSFKKNTAKCLKTRQRMRAKNNIPCRDFDPFKGKIRDLKPDGDVNETGKS